MGIWTEIVISLGTSIAGSALVIWLGYLKWRKPYSKFMKMGIVKIYPNQKKAEKDILLDIEGSKKMRIFAVRGATFSNPEDNAIAERVLRDASLEQCYLISNPINKYLGERAGILNDKNLISGVKKSISDLKKASNDHSNITLRQHMECMKFRIFLFDDHLYLSFIEDKRAKHTDILKIHKNSPLYNTYSTLFDDLWDRYC